MAMKPVTFQRKNGDLYLPKTSIGQVIGLSDELLTKQNALTQEQLDAVNSGVTSETVGKISDMETKIPAQATNENQLADKDFVNSSINASAARFVAYDANNANFPTKAALLASVNWFNAGAAYVPQKNDYLVVLADETQNGAQVRYLVVADFTAGVAPTNQIQLQYIINDAPFTAAQNTAINSGITEGKVAEYDALVSEMGDYATKALVEGLGTVRYVQAGADLSAFSDNDLFVVLDIE